MAIPRILKATSSKHFTEGCLNMATQINQTLFTLYIMEGLKEDRNLYQYKKSSVASVADQHQKLHKYITGLGLGLKLRLWLSAREKKKFIA